MAFIDQYFSRKKADFGKLEECGFRKENGYHCLAIPLHQDEFRAEISVRDKDSKVFSVVYDNELDEPYPLIDNTNAVGDFIGSLRQELEDKILPLVSSCFHDTVFISTQANRLDQLINQKYHVVHDYPFKDDHESAVYRHEDSSWFALVIKAPKDKLFSGSAEQEVINLKVPEEQREEILKIDGVYPPYHMSKRHWISVVLDDTLNDEALLDLVSISYKATSSQSSHQSCAWVFPSAPKMYPLEKIMDCDKKVIWWKNKGNQIGDIVYLYSTQPDGYLMYETEVTSFCGHDEEYDRDLMELTMIRKFEKNRYTFSVLKTFGLTSIRGPRRIPDELYKELRKNR